MAQYLLAAAPLPGHVAPMVHIGADLRSRGHDVTVLTSRTHQDAVRDAGLKLVLLPPGADVDSPSNSRTLARVRPALARRYLRGGKELRSVFIEPLPSQFRALEQLQLDCFDAILADVAFTGVVPLLLADTPRPPILVCGLGPLTLSSADTPPFGMAWQPKPDVDYRRMTRGAHRMLLHGIQRRFDNTLRTLRTGPTPVFVTDWPRLADGLLQLTVAGFEYRRRDLPTSVEFVGPVLPDSAAGFARPRWWDDMSRTPIVVHVTQGTFDNVDLDQLIGPTLAALADQPDLLVVATTGRRAGQTLRASVPSNARIAEWIPYSLLMPCVDVVVTNGGYGGVQHALSHGVPLVVAGETSDKAEVAARVEYSGAGIDLKTATPSPSAISAAVKDIVARADYRAAATRLRDEIHASTPLDSIAERLGQHASTRAELPALRKRQP